MSGARHPLAQARGLGSAKQGTAHWLAERISSIALLLLMPWGAWLLFQLAGTDVSRHAEWVADPWIATGLIALLLSLFYHLALGLQVIIEDYIHQPVLEITLLLAVKLGAFAGAILGVIHVLRPVLGS